MSTDDKGDNSAFSRWYQRNKSTFNEERKKRYHTDAQYRKRVLKYAKDTRVTVAQMRPAEYTTNFLGAAEKLDVTLWTLRGWWANGYFPEPLRFGGERWFTDAQVALLAAIRDYLREHKIRKPSAAQKEHLEDLANFVHANW